MLQKKIRIFCSFLRVGMKSRPVLKPHPRAQSEKIEVVGLMRVAVFIWKVFLEGSGLPL